MHVLQEKGGKLRGIVNLKGKLANIYWVRDSQHFCVEIDDTHCCYVELSKGQIECIPEDVMEDVPMKELRGCLDELDVDGVLKCNDEWYVIVQEDAEHPNIMFVAGMDSARNVGTIDFDDLRIVESAPVTDAAPRDTSKFCGVFSTNGKDLCDVFYDSGMREYFYKDVNGKTVSFRLADPRTGTSLEPNVLPEARKDNVYKFANGTNGRIYTAAGMVLFERTDKEDAYSMTLSTYDGVLKTKVGAFRPAECIV